MKNLSNLARLLIVFFLLLISGFCGLNLVTNLDTQSNDVVTASSVTHNFQIKNCENISEAITSVTSQYPNNDYAIAFFHKNQDLTIDANGNYLVHKDIFESKTGLTLASNLTEIYDLTELASIHGYEVNNGEFNIILTRKFGTKRLMLETQKNDFNLYGAVAVSSHDNFYILQYATEEQTAIAYNYYLSNKEISNIVPDSICWSESETSRFDDIPFDDTNAYTWGCQAMGVDKYKTYLKEIINASNINRTELQEVVVAVIDSGIDTDHPWFSGRLLIDQKGNYIGKDYTGVNVSGYEFEDDAGHGTHCAGIICHMTLPNVKILPIKVLKNDSMGGSSGNASDIWAAESYILNMKKKYNIVAVNMSLSHAYYEETYPMYERMIERLYKAGILSVVAAGNQSQNASERLPASVSRAITVSAIDKYLAHASYSNYGDVIDVCAPGDDVVSAYLNGTLISSSGTSMAAPHVAGYIALLKSDVTQNFSVTDIEAVLQCRYSKQGSTVYDLGLPGKDRYFGYGLPILDGVIPDYISLRTMCLGSGKISPSGFQMYDKNSSIKLKFYPSEGYELYAIYINGNPVPNAQRITEYTFEELVGKNNVILFDFRKTYRINYYLEPIDSYNFGNTSEYLLEATETRFGKLDSSTIKYPTYQGFTLNRIEENLGEALELNVYYSRKRYNITINVNGNGSVISKTKILRHGDSLDLDFKPEKGHKVKTVSCNGKAINFTGTSCKIENVITDLEITVEYESYNFNDMNLCDFVLCILTGLILVLLLMKITKPRLKKGK